MSRNKEIEIKSFKVYPVDKDYYEDEYGHSGYVDNNRHARETFAKGEVWADEHPKSGLVDVDDACAWLENELPTHSEMTPHSIKFFVECFRSNFTNKNKQQ